MRSAAVAAGVLALAAPAAAQTGGAVAGRVSLSLPGGRTAPAPEAVVWVAGARPPAFRASLHPPSVASKDKRFVPHVLVVTRGATVAFPNSDSIYHNAFSRTPGAEFDLGLYRRGASRTYTFASPGLVHLYCNIHAEMAAYVVVLEPSDAFALADAAGAFRLEGLPPGRQTLQVWDERGGETQVAVEVTEGGSTPIEVVLDATSFRRLPHKNKFGRDYPPAHTGVDRY